MGRHTVASLFDDFGRAKDAVDALETAGIAPHDISMVANDAGSALATEMNRRESRRREDNRARGIGATLGIVVGGTLGLLASGGALALPGIGHALAGSLVTGALAGAGLGAAAGITAGSLFGALVEAGVPEALAHVYSEAVRRGGILIAVSAPVAEAPRIADILSRFAPVDIEALGAQYRDGGWRPAEETGHARTGGTRGLAVDTAAPEPVEAHGARNRLARRLKQAGDRLTGGDAPDTSPPRPDDSLPAIDRRPR